MENILHAEWIELAIKKLREKDISRNICGKAPIGNYVQAMLLMMAGYCGLRTLTVPTCLAAG